MTPPERLGRGNTRGCRRPCLHEAEARNWRIRAEVIGRELAVEKARHAEWEAQCAAETVRAARMAEQVTSLSAQVGQLTRQVEALKARICTLNRLHFGPKSEQQPGEPGPVSPPESVNRPEPDIRSATPADPPPQHRRGQRRGAPGHGRRRYTELPQEIVTHEMPAAQRQCQNCGARFEQIAGFETSEELDIEIDPRRLVHRRLRYRPTCDCPQNPDILAAPVPPKLIPKGLFSTRFITWLLAEKFQLARPLNRTAIELRWLTDLPLATGSVIGVFRRLPPLLEPLVDAIWARNQAASFRQHDETSWPIRDGGRRRGWLWFSGTADTACFQAADSRASEVLGRRYAQWAASQPGPDTPNARERPTMLSDFFAVYPLLARLYGLIVAYCWAHMRRYFVRAQDAYPRLLGDWAQAWLTSIRELYRLYDARKAEAPDTPAWLDADRSLRQHVQGLLLQAEGQLFGPTDLHPHAQKVLLTLLTHWDGLTAFLDHPEVPLDNNRSERELRNPVVGRKNFYGSGATWCAELAAALWTIFATAILNGLNPFTFLHAFLEATARNGGQPLAPEQVRRFLPWAASPEDRTAWSRPLWGNSS